MLESELSEGQTSDVRSNINLYRLVDRSVI